MIILPFLLIFIAGFCDANPRKFTFKNGTLTECWWSKQYTNKQCRELEDATLTGQVNVPDSMLGIFHIVFKCI